MRVVSTFLAFALIATPAIAQQQSSQPIQDAAQKAATAAAAERPSVRHGSVLWSGVVLGIAGVTTAVLGTTAYRVEDRSTGNAPRNTYRACVAQKADPIYATNDCGFLKGMNAKLVWGGAGVAAIGVAMIFSSTSSNTSAEVGRDSVHVVHRVRF